MIDYSKTSQIMYGGDYNPEQWPEESWPEDMHMLRDAGINIVTLNVFSWAAIQPSEEVYDFSRLDRIGKRHEDMSCHSNRSSSGMDGQASPGYPES